MNEYFAVLPLKYIWLKGGSGGGGGGTTTNTTNSTTKNEMLPWKSYVPAETSTAYEKTLMPQLVARANQGLTPQEQALYTGQGMKQLAGTWGGAQKSLAGNLARSGARGGAVTEAYGDLARQKILGSAGMLGNIQSMDVAQKGANIDRLMKGISLPGSPVIIGSQTSGTNTANYAPQRQSGGGMS
jgi:hypothetical protein